MGDKMQLLTAIFMILLITNVSYNFGMGTDLEFSLCYLFWQEEKIVD